MVRRKLTPRWIIVTVLLVLLAACKSDTLENAVSPVEPPTTAAATSSTAYPAVASSAPSASESTISPGPVEVISFIPYGEEPLAQTLDVYLPDTGDAQSPTILAIHGGGFWARNKSDYEEFGRRYARRGYAVVAINYRLVPSARYPAQVADSFCALAWLHANAAEYGFDVDRVAVTGQSAGGYLAAMLAVANDPEMFMQDCTHGPLPDQRVHAAVVYYGLFDFVTMDDFPSSGFEQLEDFWGEEHHELTRARLEEMSPIAHLDGDDPPFILLHGTDDQAVPSVMSERFAAALRRTGANPELILLPDAGHAFALGALTTEPLASTLLEVDDFLEEVFGTDSGS